MYESKRTEGFFAKRLYRDKTISLDDICTTLKMSKSTLYRYIAMHSDEDSDDKRRASGWHTFSDAGQFLYGARFRTFGFVSDRDDFVQEWPNSPEPLLSGTVRSKEGFLTRPSASVQ